MKAIRLKNLCISIFICAMMFGNLIHVHAGQKSPGVERLNAGIAAYEHGEYDDAMFKLEMAVYQIPEGEKEFLWDAHLYLGLSYLLMGDADESTNQFIKAQGLIKNKLPDSDIHSPKIARLFKEAKEVKTIVVPKTKFRSTPRENLSYKIIKSMLKEHNFFCREYRENNEYCNPDGSGFDNKFVKQNRGQVVYDHASGLTWQQSGSDNYMSYKEANVYVKKLNSGKFAGYNDWRLPTLEETMSLMEPFEKNGDLYVDSMFDKSQRWIWTSDKNSASRAWVVYFNVGYCVDLYNFFYFSNFVRVVR